jgi:hypothetical protein
MTENQLAQYYRRDFQKDLSQSRTSYYISTLCFEVYLTAGSVVNTRVNVEMNVDLWLLQICQPAQKYFSDTSSSSLMISTLLEVGQTHEPAC